MESANGRNAQNMASVAATARAAGFTNHIATPEEWAEALNDGIIVTNALGHVLGEFRVGGLSEERVTAAIQYLVVTNTHLVIVLGSVIHLFIFERLFARVRQLPACSRPAISRRVRGGQ
jgi:hypothetical protein